MNHDLRKHELAGQKAGEGILPRASGGRLDLAIFGKHPALGAEHHRGMGRGLRACKPFKTAFYDKALGVILGTRLWQKAPDEEKLLGFDHHLLIQTRRVVIVGRVLSRGDAAGRKTYPLVLCCRVSGFPICAATPIVSGALEALESSLDSAESEADVRGRLATAQGNLDRQADALLGGTDRRSLEAEHREPMAEEFIARRAAEHIFGERGELIGPIVRSIREVGRLGLTPWRRRLHVRAPRARDIPLFEELIGWSVLSRAHARIVSPHILLAPRDHEWIDLLLGAATPQDYSCLLLKRPSRARAGSPSDLGAEIDFYRCVRPRFPAA